MKNLKKTKIRFLSNFKLQLACLIAILATSCTSPNENNQVQDVFLNNQTPIITDSKEIIEDTKYKNVAYAGDNVPISRALVAKMLAYSKYNSQEIDGLERIINFTDSSIESWYDRYINAVVSSGFMSGSGEEFMPEKPLTLEQAQILLDKLHVGNKVKIQISNENKNKAISYALWTELYFKVLTNFATERNEVPKHTFGVEAKEIIILATPDNNQKLTNWNMITSTGPLSYKGLNFGEYLDKKVNVLIKNGEILAFLGVNDHTPTIQNAYISTKTENSITIFVGGCERTYKYNTKTLGQVRIANVKINGETAEKVEPILKSTTGVVKKIDSNVVELEGQGEIKLSEGVAIYSVLDGTAKWKNINSVAIGTDTSEFVLKNNEVVAIIIARSSIPNNIRVILNTTGFKSLYHQNVSLTSDNPFKVFYGDKEKSFAANEVFELSFEDKTYFENGVKRLYVEPSSNAKIQINSITRNKEIPRYRGKIEIGTTQSGLTIVNELSMNEYLYAVVPSEMPTGHGLEAAKVQAVTARSYAYNQYYTNKYNYLGANVDDSVSSQVYNNSPENPNSIQAVNETTGMCLTFNGEVISANYFSTSSGSTANSGEVWANTGSKEFPAVTPPYLKSIKQYYEGDFGDLSQNENAHNFFKNIEVKAYDSSFAWFRWNTTMTKKQLTDTINDQLKTRYDANPFLIKTLQGDIFKSVPVDTIGEFVDMEIVKRGGGGNIMELKIIGTQNTILVQSELNIRYILKPAKVGDGQDVLLTKKDGVKMTNYSLLPSSFFTIEKQISKENNVESITFFGGGNGHGAGMSQNGVKGMIDKGFNFEQILTHYYNGTVVKKMI